MTATTVNGNNISNIAAGTVIDKQEGWIKVIIDEEVVATTSIDEVGDAILFGPIPSNARILDIQMVCDELDAHATPTLDLNVGLYYMGDSVGQRDLGKSRGDVLDADCFATDSAIAVDAVVTWTSLRFEAANITTVNLEAWEIGGLSADPGGHFAIGLTVGTNAAATAASGDVALKITYM